MANPFAYEDYRKDKIRQKIEESRTQRVQVKVRGPDKMCGYSLTPKISIVSVGIREKIISFLLFLAH